MDIIIKSVENIEENGKLIMLWRNDKNTRNMSFNSEILKWDEFKTTFSNNYFNNYIPPLFAYHNKIKVAFIGFISNNSVDPETSKSVCKIGINISPNYRGKGFGKIIIKECIEFIKINYPAVKKIVANIKCTNIASIKLFEHSRFIKKDTYKFKDEDVSIYIYEF